MEIFPNKPKSLKSLGIELLALIGAGFGFSFVHDYEWQPAFIGGTIAWIFLSFLPAIFSNAIYYWRNKRR